MSAWQTPTAFRDSTQTVRHSLDGAWGQTELGEAFDVTTLSVIGELDPTGANGVVREVLALFQDSLETALDSIERDLRAPAGAKRLRFAAHKLKSAAGQLGALRLAAACAAVEKQLTANPERSPRLDLDLRLLVDVEVTEIIRVQRRLRALLD
jgi:HPt (histidine-containing phosphotransfer) domain-containing protein